MKMYDYTLPFLAFIKIGNFSDSIDYPEGKKINPEKKYIWISFAENKSKTKFWV